MAQQRAEDEARLRAGIPINNNGSEEFIHHYEKPSMDSQSMTSSQAPINEKPVAVNWAVRPEEFFDPNWQPKAFQKVVGEGILLAGGGVAILLQVANPGVGAGVDEHSNFAYRPIDRLRTTMSYLYTMAFGTPLEKRTIISMVHRAHAPVVGQNYNANDPELQLWVAATLYAAGVDIYEKIYGRLDPRDADRVYREYSVLAMSLRVPPSMWPPTRADFWTYWDAQISSFTVSPHAQNVAKDLMWNKEGPLWMRMNLPLIRLLTAEWLPPDLRDAYGLKSSKSRTRMYKALMGTGRVVYPVLPKFVRQYPLRFYMKDMRKRMKAVEGVV